MDGLSVAASVVGIISLGIQAAQGLINYYSAYKSQKKYVADIIRNFRRLLETLETITTELQNRKFRADEQDVLRNIEDLVQDCKRCIEELDSETAKLKSEVVDSIRDIAKIVGRRVAYPFRRSTLLKLEENVDEILSHLELAQGLLLQKDVDRIQDDTEYTKALLDLVRADQVSSSIRTWLRAPDAAINYNEACKKRHPDTGLWFVKGASFSAWLTQPHSFLWANGFAGCGKSVLCSTAIQFTFRHRRSNPRIGIAFFFFTFNDISKQDTSAMLRTLVLQLSSQLNDGHQLLSRLHDSYCNAMPPDQALMDCLSQLVRAFDDTYIILDALDESPRDTHRSEVLQSLSGMRAWSAPGLHLLVTSRDEPDIRDDLDAPLDQIILLKNESVDSDIAAFVSGHLKQNKRLRKWENHHSRIETVLASRAKGVFRWVECQFKALESCPQSEDLLDRLLESLPRSLDETYEQMLLKISEDWEEYARRILSLLCCAKRPLKIPELIDATAVELGDCPKFNQKRRLQNSTAIHEVCPGFIEVDINPEDGDATVRIAHFSVQEYLESERIRQHKVAIFSVRRPEAHAEMASICLTYLLEPAFCASGSGEYLPFAWYAGRTWDEHYGEGDRSLHKVEVQALRLFRTEGAFNNWKRQKYLGEEHSPVFVASMLGLDSILSQLLSEKPSFWPNHGSKSPSVPDLVNELCGGSGTALQIACSHSHEAVARLLLDYGAEVNVQGGMFGNALQAASYYGSEVVARLLLDRGADVKAQGGMFGNALQAASYYGSEVVAQLLLDYGADVNVQGGKYGNALQAASARGHEDIVRLLLDRGADVNAQGGMFGNALQAASYYGSEVVARLLLDRGADVNVQAGYYGTALQAASFGGHEDIVRLLLDRGAEVNAQGGIFGTALKAASSQAVVQMLVKHGAIDNVPGTGNTQSSDSE